MAEHILILFFSCTKRYDLYCILTQFIHYICNKIKSLLICQSGYDTDHHSFMILFQTKFLLKCDLVLDLLFTEIADIIISLDLIVCQWIIIFIINSVHNSRQAVCSCIHKTVQFLAIEWCLNFLCIRVTYRRYSVRIYDSTLQVVCILVCFQLIRCKIILW